MIKNYQKVRIILYIQNIIFENELDLDNDELKNVMQEKNGMLKKARRVLAYTRYKDEEKALIILNLSILLSTASCIVIILDICGYSKTKFLLNLSFDLNHFF